MAEVLQEENQKLRQELAAVQERLHREIEMNRSLSQQAQLVDASLPPELKNDQYGIAYEAFEHYNSGYGYAETLPDGYEQMTDATSIDKILSILYEVQATFEENISISSQMQRYVHFPSSDEPYTDILVRQDEASPLEHLQIVTKELQSRSDEFAQFLTSYVNMLTKKNITEIRSQAKNNLEPYFAERSDLRQVTNKLSNLYESGLLIQQDHMSTMSSDLRTAVLGVITALIHVLKENQEVKS